MKKLSYLIAPVILTALLIALIPTGVNGAAVVIDDMTYTPEEPMVEDTIGVTATIVISGAEVQDEGVVLVWSMCTATTCDLPNYITMTEISNNTWTASITNMPSESGSGDPYIEVKFHVEVTADPTDGGTEPIEVENDQVTLALKESAGPVDDDDDDTDDDDTTDDDDDDGDDSPIGAGLVIFGIATAALALFFSRKRDH